MINFIILSPEPNIGRLKGTIRSIKNNYNQDSKIICSIEKSIKKPQLDEYRSICPTFKAGQTITSLINSGIKHTHEGWNMLIMEGAWVPRNVEARYKRWIKDEKDILFPIVINYDRAGNPTKVFCNFIDCTLNGILIDKKFFLSIGNLSENPLKISREFWSYDAIEKGAKFKGILGIKIC